jgi:hypothetical protein
MEQPLWATEEEKAEQDEKEISAWWEDWYASLPTVPDHWFGHD